MMYAADGDRYEGRWEDGRPTATGTLRHDGRNVTVVWDERGEIMSKKGGNLVDGFTVE